MWGEKVTSLIAKTSCDWYKFDILGHFQAPGGALWLVYPGPLPKNPAEPYGKTSLQIHMDYTIARLTNGLWAFYT